MKHDDHREITQWLTEHGHTPEAIRRIIVRLQQFDENINRQSLFDAIETGEFDFDALVKETLAEDPQT